MHDALRLTLLIALPIAATHLPRARVACLILLGAVVALTLAGR